jgi:hypothetical protein
MPLYNTTTVAAALGVPPKWLDNLLSHNNIDGLQSESQGVARRLSFNTIMILTLAREIIDAITIPAPAALKLAARILDGHGNQLVISPSLSITIQVELLRSDVLGRLARAVEIAPTPRRGRPPKR